MTVADTPRKAGPFYGNGSTTTFPFDFKVFAKEDIRVVITDPDTGAATDAVLDSDYSVVMNVDQDAQPGGTVGYPIIGAPLALNYSLTVIGSLPIDQRTDITNVGRFSPDVIERSLDRATIQIQQLDEVLNRTLQAAVGTTFKLQFPAPSAGQFIRWRDDKTGLENAYLSGSGLISYKFPAPTSVERTQQSKLAETVSVLDFGADRTGVADSTAAFNAALSASKKTLVPDGIYRVTGVTVPLNGSLELSQGAALRPATADTNMIRLIAGGTIKGGLIDTTNLAFTATAIDINGDDQAVSGFALHVETRIETTLKGAFGIGKGTAIYMHADGLPTARIMGVDARVRIYGFTFGVRLRQTSLDGSQFVNSNRIDAWCSECWQALQMDTPSNNWHLDGNIIRIQHQPRPGTTYPSINVAGQYNQIYIAPWDWDTVVGTSPYAVILLPGARYNELTIIQDNPYLQNNSGNTLNSIKTLTNDYGGRINNMARRFFPPYPGSFLQSNCSLYAGGGAPPAADGINGDIYFNSGGSAGTTIWQKRGGSWVGIV